LVRVALKAVLHKFEYIRLVNEVTGIERVVEGPVVLVPDPTEVSVVGDNHSKFHNEMVQHAILIDKDHAVLVLNQATGQQRLVTEEGMWIPAPYEHLVEKRTLIRVLANEAVVVRDYEGLLTVYDGTAGGAGTAFFLPARSQMVSMMWSVYSMPGKNGNVTITQASIDTIDMRIQRTFYSYAVRTSDNVELMLMGTIFWRVDNVTKMILGTSDPSGDVWHHCRSSFMQAVSNTTFDSFMGSFNSLAKDAYYRDVSDGFYEERGVSLLSMEVTRFEAIDAETKATLKKINEETTNQITLLKKQEGENAVRAAKMRSDISLEEEQTQAELRLEGQKTSLIETRTGNNLLQKKADAEGDAQPFAQHAKSFIEALNETGVSVTSGLGLYRVLREAEHHNEDTKNLASGHARLFLTSKDVKLNLRNLNLGSSNSSSQNDPYPCDL
jgi:regulator of protease activity HflC (stomatin/prohibitin superfamily)